jgi:hypothetical protein
MRRGKAWGPERAVLAPELHALVTLRNDVKAPRSPKAIHAEVRVQREDRVKSPFLCESHPMRQHAECPLKAAALTRFPLT